MINIKLENIRLQAKVEELEKELMEFRNIKKELNNNLVLEASRVIGRGTDYSSDTRISVEYGDVIKILYKLTDTSLVNLGVVIKIVAHKLNKRGRS